MVDKVVEKTEEQIEQEESAALSAGYRKARGEPQDTQTQEPAASQTQEPDAAADKGSADAAGATDTDGTATQAGDEQQDAAPDPWASIPKEVREEFERVRATANQVGSAQRHIKELEDQLKELRAAGQAARAAQPASAAPTADQIQNAATSGAKWKQMKEDFPEWAEAMEEVLAAQAAASPGAAHVDVEKLQKEWQAATQELVSSAVAAAEENAYVRFKYPEWKKTVNTPEFQTWMQSVAAPDIKALADSDLADDAIRMLDSYAAYSRAAAAKAAAEAKNKQRLNAVIEPAQASSGGPTILPDEAGLSIGYNRVKNKRAA